MFRFCSDKRPSENGQGLVEYALILVLVGIVVLAALLMLGPNVGNVFTGIVNAIENPSEFVENVVEDDDTVSITRADYSAGNVHMDALSDGVYDPSVTLTTSPGGVMTQAGGHYHRNISVTCPCTITVTSSAGGSSTVTIP